MDRLINCYIDMTLQKIINVKPRYLNDNLKDNLLDLLKVEVDKKCINGGYIYHVYDNVSISKISPIDTENFTGNVICNVNYKALVCRAINEKTMLATIVKIKQDCQIIIANNGPILTMIMETKLDKSKFELNGSKIINIKNKEEIQCGDTVLIDIKQFVCESGSSIIVVVSELIDKVDLKKIDKQYHPRSSLNSNDVVENRVSRIDYFNEDVNVDDTAKNKSVNTNYIGL